MGVFSKCKIVNKVENVRILERRKKREKKRRRNILEPISFSAFQWKVIESNILFLSSWDVQSYSGRMNQVRKDTITGRKTDIQRISRTICRRNTVLNSWHREPKVNFLIGISLFYFIKRNSELQNDCWKWVIKIFYILYAMLMISPNRYNTM